MRIAPVTSVYIQRRKTEAPAIMCSAVSPDLLASQWMLHARALVQALVAVVLFNPLYKDPPIS